MTTGETEEVSRIVHSDRQQMSGGSSSIYQPPRVVVHGSVVDLTRANVVGTVTDKTFPAGTAIDHLTFSG
jgi:hypothetical protein